MRNKGFTFTTDQRLARWDDTGGPGRFEKWGLQGRWQFTVSRLVMIAAVGAAAALVTGWLLSGDAGYAVGAAGGFLLGSLLVVLVAGKRMWARERDVYDTWLTRRPRHPPAAHGDT